MAQGSHPDDLTAREREVLDLVRLGLTNEEIARRLGITEAGAKYHVSQILSRLGVTTREEAAGVALTGRRRWWVALPLAAKVAGVAFVLAAVAGLGVLAWGVLRTSGESEGGSFGPAGCELTVEAVAKCYAQATQRPNLIYHVTASFTLTFEQVSLDGKAEGWTDWENQRARSSYDVDESGIHRRWVLLGETYYLVTTGGNEAPTSSKGQRSNCLDAATPIPTVTLCPAIPLTSNTTVRADVLDGGPVVIEETNTQYEGHTLTKTRTTLDASSYLPILFERELGSPPTRWETRYQNEFVDADSVPDNFFDPASIGYVEPSPTP